MTRKEEQELLNLTPEQKERILAEVKGFFARLSADRRQGRRTILDDMAERYCHVFNGLDRSGAIRCIGTLVVDDLYEYFAQPRFLKLETDGRIAWLRSMMMKGPKGLAKMKASVQRAFPEQTFEVDELWEKAYMQAEDVRARGNGRWAVGDEQSANGSPRPKAHSPKPKAAGRKDDNGIARDKRGRFAPERPLPEDIRERQRSNHPLGEFEWSDPATRQRYYDDPEEGLVAIPCNAPPRPTKNARWNVLRKAWYADGAPVGKNGEMKLDL